MARPRIPARNTAKFGGVLAGATDSNTIFASAGNGVKSAADQLPRWKSLMTTSSRCRWSLTEAGASIAPARANAVCTLQRTALDRGFGQFVAQQFEISRWLIERRLRPPACENQADLCIGLKIEVIAGNRFGPLKHLGTAVDLLHAFAHIQ